jgi:hypothetical protein
MDAYPEIARSPAAEALCAAYRAWERYCEDPADTAHLSMAMYLTRCLQAAAMAMYLTRCLQAAAIALDAENDATLFLLIGELVEACKSVAAELGEPIDSQKATRRRKGQSA